MDEIEFETWLRKAINLMNEEDFAVKRIDSFEEMQLMTKNRGLVVKTNDGEFQVTIVRSK